MSITTYMPLVRCLRPVRGLRVRPGGRIPVRGYTGRGNVVDELEQRGFVAALTSPKLRDHVTSPTAIYSGVDPSADSLHVGNLLPLLGLLHFHASGHQAIALIGGATGSIGDPSGRSSERPILSSKALQHNVAGITNQVNRFFERGMEYIERRGGAAPASGKQVKVLNNLDWFKDVSFLDFLRTTGKMARVNVMLARDSVKNRLESGISFTEFSYQLLQAHDFAHLHKYHDCRIQLGGSDQWGNIVAGIDLIKRQLRGEDEVSAGEGSEDPAYGLTIPLLTTSSGAKFGKSAGNAVWLDETKTSASDFYQFFVRSTDEDVERYLRIFTFLPLSQIDEIMASHGTSRKTREAQKVLAREVIELVHGPAAVQRAELSSDLLFHTVARRLRAKTVLEAFEGDSRLRKVKWKELKDVPISKLMVTFGMVKARADASRIISSKSLYLNDGVVNDPRALIYRQNLVDGKLVVLRHGNKNHLILFVED